MSRSDALACVGVRPDAGVRRFFALSIYGFTVAWFGAPTFDNLLSQGASRQQATLGGLADGVLTALTFKAAGRAGDLLAQSQGPVGTVAIPAVMNALAITASPYIDAAVQAITQGRDASQAVEDAWKTMQDTLGEDVLGNLVACALLRGLKWTEWKQEKPSSVDANVQRGQQAIQTALETHENILNAMSRDDLGSVSFYWGTPGRGAKFKQGEGLAHIDAKHGRDVLHFMPEVIAKGVVVESQPPGFTGPGQRVLIGYEGHTAVLSLWKYGEKQTWLLTGWDNYPPSDGTSGAFKPVGPTHADPTSYRTGVGAEAGKFNIAQPDTKDNVTNENTAYEDRSYDQPK